ncbi:hypothetical protein BpHYR1_047201, partial [Brachionus plicatilis]
YYFPILNTLSENLVRKLQVIQNYAIRSILKLKFDIPSEILHHEGWSQLSQNKIDHRLDELTERYVRNALENSSSLDNTMSLGGKNAHRVNQYRIFFSSKDKGKGLA